MAELSKKNCTLPKVLIVADTTSKLADLNTLLASLDIEIYPVNSSSDALAMSKKHEFAAILLNMADLDLPHSIRKQELSSNTPLLLVINDNEGGQFVKEGHALSPIDYVFKPVDSVILTCKITMLCNLYCREKALKNLLQENNGIRKTLEKTNKELNQLAHHDSLTSLPNRLQFERKIDSAISSSKRYNRNFALLLIDLDNFKSINDTLGHTIGDLLLRAVSEKLQKCFRKNDLVTLFGKDSMVSRLGGDEFAIMLSELRETDDAGIAAKRALSQISGRYHLAGKYVYTSASIGIACFPAAGNNLSTLYKNADTAMYAAKDKGKNQYRYYTPNLDERHHKNLQIQNAIKLAMKKKNLTLDYQPIYQLKNQKIVGIEAQVTCQVQGVEKNSPAELLPAAEKSGIVSSVIEWILNEAFQQQTRWLKSGYRDHFLSVKLSSKQFSKNDLCKKITKLAGKNKSLIKSIHLELSETALMVDLINHERVLANLRDSGFSLSIDRFGASNSSLMRIKSLSVNTIKIDRSLIQGIHNNPGNTVIVKSILALSTCLSLNVIAEGIETKSEFELLCKLGCAQGQGPYFSHALPASELTRLLSNEKIGA